MTRVDFRSFTVLGLAVLALVSAGACGGGSTVGNAGSLVQVQVSEYQVVPNQTSAALGRVVFQVTNAGTVPHEFLVVKTDLALDALPTQADGSFDEGGAGVDVLGEIPEFEPGGTYELKLDLAAGNYVLLCNRVVVEDDGEIVSHFHKGMRTVFSAS